MAVSLLLSPRHLTVSLAGFFSSSISEKISHRQIDEVSVLGLALDGTDLAGGSLVLCPPWCGFSPAWPETPWIVTEEKGGSFGGTRGAHLAKIAPGFEKSARKECRADNSLAMDGTGEKCRPDQKCQVSGAARATRLRIEGIVWRCFVTDVLFLLREIDSAEQRLRAIDFGMFMIDLRLFAGASKEKAKHW